MSIRIVQLGSPRTRGEGLRIGTVRRPPRGVRKEEYAEQDYFDVWYPNLSPSRELMEACLPIDSPQAWERFARRFKREMAAPDASRTLDVLAALSHSSSFAVGCYCGDESRCHRSILRELLEGRGAKVG